MDTFFFFYDNSSSDVYHFLSKRERCPQMSEAVFISHQSTNSTPLCQSENDREKALEADGRKNEPQYYSLCCPKSFHIDDGIIKLISGFVPSGGFKPDRNS